MSVVRWEWSNSRARAIHFSSLSFISFNVSFSSAAWALCLRLGESAPTRIKHARQIFPTLNDYYDFFRLASAAVGAATKRTWFSIIRCHTEFVVFLSMLFYLMNIGWHTGRHAVTH